MSELLNCPFCYSANVTIAGTQAHTYICCEDCKAGIPGSPYGGRYYDLPRDEAIERWNRRTPQPVTPAGGEVGDAAVNPVDHAAALSLAIRQQTSSNLARCYIEIVANEAAKIEPTHQPVADAALVRDAERYRWWRENIDLLDQQSLLGIAYSCQIPVHNGHVPTAELMDMIADSQDAALNQRGGDRE